MCLIVESSLHHFTPKSMLYSYSYKALYAEEVTLHETYCGAIKAGII